MQFQDLKSTPVVISHMHVMNSYSRIYVNILAFEKNVRFEIELLCKDLKVQYTRFYFVADPSYIHTYFIFGRTF